MRLEVHQVENLGAPLTTQARLDHQIPEGPQNLEEFLLAPCSRLFSGPFGIPHPESPITMRGSPDVRKALRRGAPLLDFFEATEALIAVRLAGANLIGLAERIDPSHLLGAPLAIPFEFET